MNNTLTSQRPLKGRSGRSGVIGFEIIFQFLCKKTSENEEKWWFMAQFIKWGQRN